MGLNAQYTSTATAFKLTATPASGYALAPMDPSLAGNRPTACLLQAETHDIRFTVNGTAPTSTVGMLLVAGADPLYWSDPLIDLRFIQTESGSILNVTYIEDVAAYQRQGPAGVVQTVVAGDGINVDSSDPANPVVSNTGVLAVVAGDGIGVDATDPQNPIVAQDIASLSAAAALDGTELVAIDQGGDIVGTTTQDIADLAGDVVGPASATDGHLAVFDGTTGKIIKDGGTVPSSGGGLTAWDSGTTYSTGDLALDRSGTWQATGSNTNSQPVSGNTDWVFVAGPAYVDFLLNPVQITTAPFYDPTHSGPGLPLFDAPGSGLVTLMLYALTVMSDGADWQGTLSIFAGYGDTAGSANNCNPDQTTFYNYVNDISVGSAATSNPTPVNMPVVIFTPDDWTGGMTPGSRSVSARFWYEVVPVPIMVADTFFLITDVNQGTKTFTVTGDASGIGATFDVVGSTGNDGTYTKVSAIFGAGSTVIIVVEAIPDATADGWVKE